MIAYMRFCWGEKLYDEIADTAIFRDIHVDVFIVDES